MLFSYALIGNTDTSSNKESQERFSSGQNEWLMFSEQTINIALQVLPELQNTLPFPREIKTADDLVHTKFGSLLLFFAERRQAIAKQLQHGKNDIDRNGKKGRTAEYGHIRYFHEVMPDSKVLMEKLHRDNEKIWPTQNKAFFVEIDKLLNVPYSEGKIIEKEPGLKLFETEHYDIISRADNTDGENRIQMIFKFNHAVTLTKPLTRPCSKMTVMYELLMSNEGRASEAKVAYMIPKPATSMGNMELGNRYVEGMLSWSQTDGLAELLKNAGRLSQYMIMSLPTCLGTAAITEWMVRTLAFHQGVILGGFKQDNGISWDFKSLVTPNREEYAEWYAQNAFNAITMVSEIVSAPIRLSERVETDPPVEDSTQINRCTLF